MTPTPTPEPTLAQSTSPDVTSKFKEILEANGINDKVSEVIVKGSGLQGENFGGLTEYVTIKFENPSKEPLHLFVKKKTDNPEYNKVLDAWKAYQKETVFFREYLPRARELCKKMGREELLDFYPKCYYGDDTTVVLENLVVGRNFILLKKEELQNFEAARFGLTNLAKHHAISHALIQELGGPASFFKRFPVFEFEAFMGEVGRGILEPNFENGIKTNIQVLEKCDLDGSNKAIEKLKSFKGKAFEDVLGSLKNASGEFLALNHGDYWNNNMMFLKDEKTRKIVEHVPVDFQGLRYSSVCVDLGFYLFTSVKPKVRREQFKELLTIYLDSLKIVANELGHPIDLTYPKLGAEFCKHFQYGFWFGLGLTTGAAYEVMKDLDAGESSDMAALWGKWDQLIAKWVENNPEKCKEKSVDIINYVKDYEFLSRGVVPL